MKTYHYFLLLIAIGFLVFTKTLFNGFVLDDTHLIVNSPTIHSLNSLPTLFTQSFRYHNQPPGIFNFYYKPFMFVSFTFLYAIGNGNPFPFHLFQLIIYIINSLLLFTFFCKFWNKKLSFFLSLLFLLQPANIEVVSYSASLQDTLFLFFGLSSLLIASNKKLNTLLSAGIVSILLLFSLLSKESGILFIFIVPLFMFFFVKAKWKTYLFSSIISLSIYLLLRINTLTQPFTVLLDHHVQHFSLTERILASLAIFGFSIQELLLPQFKFQEFLKTGIIPPMDLLAFTLETIVFICILVFCGMWVKKTNKKQLSYFIFFSIWLILGILFHSQLFFSLDVFIALRWLYFPLVGMLGILGVLFTTVSSKYLSHSRLTRSIPFILITLYALETLFTVFFIPLKP